MQLTRRFDALRSDLSVFPNQFWLLIGATFIDHLGGALVFPFFALYVTARFGVGMTTVGVIFLIFSLSGLVGGALGGALSDRLGRKWIIVFGLLTSAAGNVVLGLANSIEVFFAAALIVGLFGSVGGPAQQAMVADLLPEHQRASGYGIQRVVMNLAVVLGPAIGGLMAARSFLLLFIVDAITSTITALIVLFFIRESRPAPAPHAHGESWRQTFGGYLDAFRDRLFVGFLIASMLATIVYMQMNSTLSVYLRDVYGVPVRGFGYLLSMNALMVVVFQFWVTRRIQDRPPLLMMVAGTLLYAVGFGMYGVVSTYALFVLAMIIITIGEMIVVPVAQALVARLAPEDKRGRYMAVYGLAWTLPTAIGPLLAGIVIDNYQPQWVWYASFVICIASAMIYWALHKRATAIEAT